MNTQEIFIHLKKIIQIGTRDMDVFLELAQVKKIKKNHKVVEQGEAVSPLIFIQKGCLMTYHEDRSGFKHVIQFGLEGWWTGDIRSMQEETASFYGIKAIENTELYCFDLGTFNQLVAEAPLFEQYFRILFQNSLISHQNALSGISHFRQKNDMRYFVILSLNWS